jgi:hypothetical protein
MRKPFHLAHTPVSVVPLNHLSCCPMRPIGTPVGHWGWKQRRCRQFANFNGELIAAGSFSLIGCKWRRMLPAWDGLSWRPLENAFFQTPPSIAHV